VGGGHEAQGWQEFLAADGVDDWVVLHGGATAVFGVPSLGEAAQLAAAVAHVPIPRARGRCRPGPGDLGWPSGVPTRSTMARRNSKQK
jgi:hypothetical protein